MSEPGAVEGYVVPEDWTQGLTLAVAGALREFGDRLRGIPIVRLAVDCHPWNGILTLALLTAEEADNDPLLLDPAEMAAWRNYGFTDGLASWHLTEALCREMRDAYAAASDRKVVADAFMKACALAMKRAEADGALGFLGVRFQVNVPHPDDGRECSPAEV